MSIEHPHIIAGPLRTAKDGQCVWMWHAFGTWLHCVEPAIPGDPWLCLDHYQQFIDGVIEHPRRSFPSVAVPSDVPPAFSKEPQP